MVNGRIQLQAVGSVVWEPEVIDFKAETKGSNGQVVSNSGRSLDEPVSMARGVRIEDGERESRGEAEVIKTDLMSQLRMLSISLKGLEGDWPNF